MSDLSFEMFSVGALLIYAAALIAILVVSWFRVQRRVYARAIERRLAWKPGDRA